MKQRNGVFIWVTWLSRWMAGEAHCEWSVWFKTRYQDYEKAPNDFNSDLWTLEHTRQVRDLCEVLAARGLTVTLEGQNSMVVTLEGAQLSGKPDLIASSPDMVQVVDVKTGQPRTSDAVQVMIYLYLLRVTRPDLNPLVGGPAKKLQGWIYYTRTKTWKEVKLDAGFEDQLLYYVRLLTAGTELRKVPSIRECSFCNIAQTHCPERLEQPLPPAA